MFRPMMILGILVIALGIASFVFVPAWRTNPVSILMIVVLIAMGGYAFVRDAITFYNDMKHEAKRRSDEDKLGGGEGNP